MLACIACRFHHGGEVAGNRCEDAQHCVGELIQIDGSDHAWSEGRAPACTLLAGAEAA
jgi:hypothetical protein